MTEASEKWIKNENQNEKNKNKTKKNENQNEKIWKPKLTTNLQNEKKMKMKMKKTDAGNENQNEKRSKKKNYFQLFQSLASRTSHNSRLYIAPLYCILFPHIYLETWVPSAYRVWHFPKCPEIWPLEGVPFLR